MYFVHNCLQFLQLYSFTYTTYKPSHRSHTIIPLSNHHTIIILKSHNLRNIYLRRRRRRRPILIERFLKAFFIVVLGLTHSVTIHLLLLVKVIVTGCLFCPPVSVLDDACVWYNYYFFFFFRFFCHRIRLKFPPFFLLTKLRSKFDLDCVPPPPAKKEEEEEEWTSLLLRLPSRFPRCSSSTSAGTCSSSGSIGPTSRVRTSTRSRRTF